MANIPILYSTYMIFALLEDRKTKTRRVMKPQPDENGVSYMKNPPLPWVETNKNPWKPWLYDTVEGERIATNCPYGEIGDILWVRETHYAFGHWIEVEKDGKTGLEFVDETVHRSLNYFYEDSKPENVQKKRIIGSCAWYKRPSIFMPKHACRIFLEVTNIRAEKLQDISEEDAKAEGVLLHERGVKWLNYRDAKSKVTQFIYNCSTAKESFKTLWITINGFRDEPTSWFANPYVWVIEFKKTERPVNFLLF